MTQLPQDLYIPCWTLGYFAPTLRESKPQVDARDQLHTALKANDADQVLDALHRVHHAYQFDAAGHYMPRRLNITVLHAEALIETLERRANISTV